MLGDVSVIDPPFLIILGLATVAVYAASWYPARRRWFRVGARALGVALTIVITAAAVNARFAYLPTFGAVFGRRASDEISAAQLRQLEAVGNAVTPRGIAGGSEGGRLALARSADGRSRLTRGVVVQFAMPGTASHFHARTGEVYLPPAYFDVPRPRLPVIELLHGSPGSPADWTRGGYADVTADEYAAQHRGFAPILVMPDVNGGWRGDSECVNGKPGNVQTYLTVDVRDAVIARFHTRTDARGWTIAGLSEGAYCALQIGLRNPGLYQTIGDFSGEEGPSVAGGLERLFAGTPSQVAADAAQYNPVPLLHGWHFSGPRPAIWFEAGSSDITLRAMVRLDGLAQSMGFATRLVVQPGEQHGFASWTRAFVDALPWMAERMRNPSGNTVLSRA
jgi:S-formylglutathione hydrolase FrmB